MYFNFKFNFNNSNNNRSQVPDKKYAQYNAKESSRKSLTPSNHDSNVKDTESLNQTKGSESPMSVSS